MNSVVPYILIIDDNQDILEILTDILEEEGHQVRTFREGENALNAALREPPELFLLDIKMPGMDGIELCGKLKQNEKTRQIPVIFISGLMDTEEKVSGFNAGGVDYITKPFQNVEVLARVNTHLQLQRSLREVRSLNQNLEQRIEERTRELRAARDEAERANKAKSDFLSNINHELRNPLNGITGMLSLLKEAEVDEETELHLNLAEYSAQHLSRIIQDILDYSKLDAGSMLFQYAPFDIRRVLENLCRIHSSQIRAKGLQIRLTPFTSDQLFTGDEVRITQIVLNLLSNAVKYSEKGTIEVTCRADEDLELEIRDQGIGIPPDRQSDIFTPFLQLEETYSKKHGGTGLGLAITKNLVESMDGTIDLESSVGAGTCFRVKIPRHPATPAAVPSPGKPDAPGPVKPETKDTVSKGKILVTEDDTVNLFYMEQLLESRGYEVLQALDGREALEQAREHRPDLILLDMGLPGMNGIETLRRLRGMEDFRNLPVIAVTAYTRKEDLTRFQEAGISEVISKPADRKTILSVLDKYLA